MIIVLTMKRVFSRGQILSTESSTCFSFLVYIVGLKGLTNPKRTS